MPFQIIRHDITQVMADAIVNTANPQPRVGSGTDSAIYKAAGQAQLLAARQAIGPLAPGEVAATPAFALSARYILHTVGPVWQDGAHGESDILRACYSRTLALAADLECESIAFPLIASGVYGFPKEAALDIALSEIGKFLLNHDLYILLVVFDRRAVVLSQAIVGAIDVYIDEHQAAALHAEEYRGDEGETLRRRRLQNTNVRPSLESVLACREADFRQQLFALIDASGLDDTTVYKRANLDRKLFSRIRCKQDYQPTKKTAVALAVALHLDLATARDLLARAGLALSPSNCFDLIVSYFIEQGVYDINAINAALFRYGEPLLGL